MILAETSIQLVPDGTLLLHLLMVGIMVFVLNRTLLKPINQILAEREKQIAGRLKEAEALAAETQEKLAQYNDALREARADGYKLLEKERAQASERERRKAATLSRRDVEGSRRASRSYAQARAVGKGRARGTGRHDQAI